MNATTRSQCPIKSALVLSCYPDGVASGGDDINDVELLKRIAALWLRYRAHPMVTSSVPQPLRELLDEAVRRTTVDHHAMRSSSDTPTETPASRRR